MTILRDPDGEIVGATVAVEPNELRKPKTKKSRRTVYLPVIAAVALAQHLDQYTGPEATAWVFCTATGTPAGKDNLRHYIKAAAQKAIGRTDLTAHVAMRHTGMTLAAQIPGVSVRDLADRAGHTDTKMSMHYIHRAQNADRAIAQALDQLAATAA